ncbi:MAG: hypothetical protein M3O86_03395, partial [Actinomycetota bacterium]|nr:hypothetical protein [Actinomycetota bacterium]
RAEAAAWVTGQVARTERAASLAHAWVSALLELPPAEMDAVIVGIVQAADDVGDEVGARFRSQTARAMAFFPVPQLLRLRDRFNDLAAGLGHRATWS